MGKGPPFSSRARNSRDLLDGGEVGGEGGVIDLVHPHVFQGSDQLVQGVGAAGRPKASPTATRTAGSDLDHRADLGVMDGPPGLADLVIDRDGAGGADGGALPTADAVGL